MIARLALVSVALLCSLPAAAHNVVLTNDDGLTANVVELYKSLKAVGHDVIVAVPCTGQSGMGAALKAMRALPPLASACLNEAAAAGAPGAGRMTREGLGPDFFYVDGTPVMSLLYGLDIVAQARWGNPPDIVISGPNVGQNVGSMLISSGTVSNAQFGMIRGIPAIAVSADEDTVSDASLVNPRSAAVAARTLELVTWLTVHGGPDRLLPYGTGLNVNFPKHLGGAPWKLTRIGDFNGYEIRFVTDIDEAAGRPKDIGSPARPGLYAGRTARAPGTDQEGDEAVVSETAISVSVMQIAYDASQPRTAGAAALLKGLVQP